MSTMKENAPRIFSWLLAMLLPIFAMYPAFLNAIEERAYDAAEFHIFRGVVFSAARADGWLYPRWVQPINGGLGGPLFEFYPPLSYFLMDVLNLLSIAHPMGWRVLTAMALLAASTGMFGLALALFRRAEVALLAAVVFTYNSYLLRDLFERGSPQGWAVALFPWLLWLLLRATENPSGWRVALASIWFAAIVLIHNATALLLLPVLTIFVAFLILSTLRIETWSLTPALSPTRKGTQSPFPGRVILRDGARRALVPIASLGVGLLLCAFYLIPYIVEVQYIQFENPTYVGYALPAANPLRLEEFLSLPRVFDTGLGNNAMAESGGLFHAGILLLAIPVGYGFFRARRAAELVLIMGNGLLVLFVIWMQTDSATFVWNAFPVLNAFQFRWRLLSVMGFVSALIVGYFFTQWQTRFKSVFISLLLTGYLLLQLPSLYPQLLFRYIQFQSRPTVADAQAFALKSDAAGLTSFNEYLPRWRQSPITHSDAERAASSPLADLPSDGRILGDSRRTGFVQTKIETPLAFTAAMNVLYYPGWVGYVDENAATIRPSERTGLIAIDVPSGAHTVELHYEGTLAQHLGDAVSIATAIALVILSGRQWSRGMTHSSTALRSAQNACVASATNYLIPRWWLAAAILFLAALKAFWIDPQTTLFRATSTCDSIQASIVQTDVWFDHRIRLCGYALSRTEYQPNDPLRMTLYWELESSASENIFSYVHLLGDQFNPETNNPLWGQQDKQTPGEHAIMDWAPRKLYRDEYAFRIAPHAPSGDYQLEVGWQDANGRRLKPNIIQLDKRLAISHLDSLLVSGIHIR